jgi:hypothetical protein
MLLRFSWTVEGFVSRNGIHAIVELDATDQPCNFDGGQNGIARPTTAWASNVGKIGFFASSL